MDEAVGYQEDEEVAGVSDPMVLAASDELEPGVEDDIIDTDEEVCGACPAGPCMEVLPEHGESYMPGPVHLSANCATACAPPSTGVEFVRARLSCFNLTRTGTVPA